MGSMGSDSIGFQSPLREQRSIDSDPLDLTNRRKVGVTAQLHACLSRAETP